MSEIIAAREQFEDREPYQHAHEQPAEKTGHCQERALHRRPQTE